MLTPLITAIIGIAVAFLLSKIRLDEKKKYMLTKINEVAESTLDMIRANNPGLKLLDQIDFYKDKLFDALLKDTSVTNNTKILARAAATTIVRKITKEKAAGLEWSTKPKG